MYQVQLSRFAFRAKGMVSATSTSTKIRCLATSEQANRARNYLDAWVGSASNVNSAEKRRLSSPPEVRESTDSALLLSGSSYLIPTLRIERMDTPHSISHRIAAALDSGVSSTGLAKTMLQGKALSNGIGVSRWQAPIILDLSALVPNGSHHYKPPPSGFLLGFVRVLKEYGILVIGVTGVPPSLEEEAVCQLGLPSFMSKARVLNRQSMTSKFPIEDVVKMILARSEQMQHAEVIVAADVEKDVEGNEQHSTVLGEGASDTSESTDDAHETSIHMLDEKKQSIEEKVDNEPDIGASLPISQVYHGSVRSGQQVAAKQNHSLIIIGSVNSGGEVLSDKDIFVFGKLRGRALAGLASNDARIMATSFDPELVCIGDTFTTIDTVTELGLESAGSAAMVSLDSERGKLVFEGIAL